MAGIHARSSSTLDDRRASRHTAPMATLDPWAPSDPLGEALHFLRMNGAFYCRSELTAPWGMTMMPMPGYIWFHVVTTGRVWLEAGDAEAQAAPARGPRPRAPRRGSRAAQRARASPRPTCSSSNARRSASATRSCATAAAARRRRWSAAPCASTTRPPATWSRSSRRSSTSRRPASPQLDWMQSTLRLMAVEARELRPGGEAVITRLGDILVIQAIRSWIETDPAARRPAGSAPSRTAQIGRAIAADPPRPGAQLDRRLARRRAGDVALGLRRALHRAGRRAGDAVRHALAHAGRASARCGRRAPPSASSRAGSATAPRPRSRARSSA